MKKNYLCIIFAFLGNVTEQTFGQCDQILKQGIYDIHSSISSQERTTSFINFFKQKDFASFTEAKSFAASAFIPLEELIIGVGLSFDQSGYQEFRREIQSYTNWTSSDKIRVEAFVQKINMNVVEAWGNCINNSGIHIWTEQTSDPKIFFIKVKYVPDDGSFHHIKSISFVNNNIQFKGGELIQANGKANQQQLTPGVTFTQGFVRKDSNSVQIVINTTKGNGYTVSLPKIQSEVIQEPLWAIQLIIPDIGPTIDYHRHGPDHGYNFVKQFLIYKAGNSNLYTFIKFEKERYKSLAEAQKDLTEIKSKPKCENALIINLRDWCPNGSFKGEEISCCGFSSICMMCDK